MQIWSKYLLNKQRGNIKKSADMKALKISHFGTVRLQEGKCDVVATTCEQTTGEQLLTESFPIVI